jgi:hypothetical protein
MRMMPRISIFAILAGVLAVPSYAQDCSALIAKLSKIQISAAKELEVSGRPGLTYKSLFDECDRHDTFAGRKLPRLQGMSQRCSTDMNKVAYIKRFSDGTIVMNAKMSVDADGSPVSAGPNASPADQAMTWLEFDKGSHRHFVNAEDVPFVVVPTDAGRGISFQRDTGVKAGDLAVIIRGTRCSIGVVGDSGPYFRLGEASLRAHADLGNPQCATGGQYPCRKLIADGMGISIPENVTYVLFPGTRPKPLLSQSVQTVAFERGVERADHFLAQQITVSDDLTTTNAVLAKSVQGGAQ